MSALKRTIKIDKKVDKENMENHFIDRDMLVFSCLAPFDFQACESLYSKRSMWECTRVFSNGQV